MLNPKQCRFLRAAAVSGLLCCQPFLPAAALTIQDFQPNCDIRQLRLTHEQYEELRTLRAEYKQAVERHNVQSRHNERTRRDHLLRILSNSQFDERLAHRYIGERYETGLQFAEDELGIQYKFYQLLNPDQQREWIQKCLN
ncbi:P pilus assembly/Cpx signaling pathway, periplasmic inhibitor/zinc-resistance associated protein [Kingella potus]|uniref:P pilus assembly/Cpx signaling pathway, periplasmic inhibitor/zinc-resistance associated protein n=1 Tax=Kingella potus TaxID=265175 RepID=A0A377R0H1_9NEIS|nr:Spy/CpxP family protein refolding chaperone [Kingella potus]STR00993.1 P pilus assembly/Cpx signaling pathway, periplasmic inhibitor/zinc-resistance associated protein [Kingella potus]